MIYLVAFFCLKQFIMTGIERSIVRAARSPALQACTGWENCSCEVLFCRSGSIFQALKLVPTCTSANNIPFCDDSVISKNQGHQHNYHHNAELQQQLGSCFCQILLQRWTHENHCWVGVVRRCNATTSCTWCDHHRGCSAHSQPFQPC